MTRRMPRSRQFWPQHGCRWMRRSRVLVNGNSGSVTVACALSGTADCTSEQSALHQALHHPTTSAPSQCSPAVLPTACRPATSAGGECSRLRSESIEGGDRGSGRCGSARSPPPMSRVMVEAADHADSAVAAASRPALDWSVAASDFSDTMTLSMVVTIGGVDQATGTLGAFVGTQARGVQSTPSSPPFGPYAGKSVYQVTVYAAAGGETLSFQFHDGSSTTPLDETLTFVVNGNSGSVTSPVALSGTAVPESAVPASSPSPGPPPPLSSPPPGSPPPAYRVKSSFSAGGVVADYDESKKAAIAAVVAAEAAVPASDVTIVVEAGDTSSGRRLQTSSGWSVTPSDFSDTMTLSMVVTIGGVDQATGTLGAFVGTQARGVQSTPSSPPFGPYAGKSIYQVTVYAAAGGETLSFQFHDGSSTTPLDETLTFVVNGNSGSVTSPVALSGTASAAPSPPSYRVRSSFSAGGDITDYDDSKKAAIASVFAAQAGVPASSVSVTIEAASVLVVVDVAASSEQSATATASSLSSGLLASASALSSALASGGVDGVSVASIDAPVPQSVTGGVVAAVAPASGVTVNVIVAVSSAQSATATASSLSSGMFASASAVSSALATGGVDGVSVASIDAPVPQSVTGGVVAAVAPASGVTVTVIVAVSSAQSATATASSLSSGMFASASAVSSALATGGVDGVSVASIDAPVPQSVTGRVVAAVAPASGVTVTVIVAVSSAQSATATASSLSSGMFASASALSSALATGGVDGVSVGSIETPTVLLPTVLEAASSIWTYRVKSSFSAGGDVADYDESKKAAIAAVVAAEAAVPASDVTIVVEAGDTSSGRRLQTNPGWSVTPSDFSDTMTLSMVVTIGGVDQATGTLGAFVGTQARGVQSTPSSPPFGPYAGKSIYQVTVYAAAGGETLSFQFHDGSSTTPLDETLTFVVNGNSGSVTSPVALSGTAVPASSPSPGPPPPLSSPPPGSPPPAYRVKSSFSAGGDVADYDESKKAAIAAVVAAEAAVPASDVTIVVEAGDTSSGRRLQTSPGWSVTPSDFSDTMTLSMVVTIGGVDQATGTLGAFVGTQARGVQSTPSTPPFGPYAGKSIYQVTVYAAAGGETLSFQFHDGSSTTPLDETLTFVVNGNSGSVTSPVALSGTAVPASSPSPGPPPPVSSPPPGSPPPAYRVKSSFSAGGDITDYDESKKAAIAAVVAAEAAVPASDVTIVVEAADTSSGRRLQTSPGWSVTPSDFSDTMTLSMVVTIGGVDQATGTLGAFVGTQARGVQSTPSSPPFGPYAGKSIYQVTVYAAAGGETLSFQFHDGSSTTPLDETLTFVVNGNSGSVTSPVALSGTAVPASSPSPGPPPPLSSPQPGSPPPAYRVKSSFSAGGVVADYDESKKAAIAAVVAAEAAVPASDVTIIVEAADTSSGRRLQTSPGWSVTPSDFSDTMTLSMVVTIGGVDQATGTLGAFVGTQARGVQSTPSSPPFGPYAGKSIYQVTVYAAAGGETLSFQFHDGSSTTPLDETLTFVVNGNSGSVTSPVALSGTASAAPSPPSYRVRSSFSAGGDITDYDDSKKAAIASVFAAQAGVPASSVSVTIEAASVLVVVDVAASSEQSATATASSLSSGMLASASALSSALASGGVDGVSVASIDAPVPQSVTGGVVAAVAPASGVTVNVIVAVSSAQSATATASSLSSGMFASASALSSALATGGVDGVSVASIDAPVPQSVTGGVVAAVAPASGVTVTVIVAVSSAQSATATASSLSSGMFASASAVSSALATGGVDGVSVASIDAPVPQSVTGGVVAAVAPASGVTVTVIVAVSSAQSATATASSLSSGMFASASAVSSALATGGVDGVSVASIDVPVAQTSDGVAIAMTGVTVTVNVAVPSQQSAFLLATSLSSGMFASASALSSALTSGGLNDVSVVSTMASEAQVVIGGVASALVPPSPPPASLPLVPPSPSLVKIGISITVKDKPSALATASHLIYGIFATPSVLASALEMAGVAGIGVDSIEYLVPLSEANGLTASLAVTTYHVRSGFSVNGGFFDNESKAAIMAVVAAEAHVSISDVVAVVETRLVPIAGRRLQTSPDWSVTASDFSDTMTLTAIVAINGADQPSGTLGAFVGTQARGVQSTPSSASFGPYAGKSLFQVTVYANAGGETISFQFHDGSSTTALSETLAFVVNGNEGGVTSPLVLSGPAAPAVDWSVTASDFSDTMTLTAIVAINGADQPSGTLGAFVGTQVRGVQSTPSSASFGPYAGKSLFQVTVYANAGGETISFQFHDGSSTTALSETLAFVVNGNEGSVTSPLALSGPATSSSASPSSPLRPPPPPSAPPLHPPLTYATTTSMLLSVGASGGLTASQLMSSLTQAATTADTSSVSVSLVVQSSLTATLPASRSAEQVAAALQLSICSTSDNSGCSVTTSRTDRRHLQTAASASFTVEQVISLTSNQSLSEVLVAPSVNVSDVSSLLAVDSSELDVGTPTVAGVAATLSVEATGTPTATVAESLSTTSMAAALGVDASQLSVLEAPRTVTPPAPPPTQPPSPPTLPPPSLPPPPQPMVNVIVDVAVPSPERAIAISTRSLWGCCFHMGAFTLASFKRSQRPASGEYRSTGSAVCAGWCCHSPDCNYVSCAIALTAYGSVEQYESSMRASIAAVVAAEGLVSASDVIVAVEAVAAASDGRRLQTSPDWSVTASDFSDTMTLTAIVTINGADQPSGTLGAFVGTQVRGVQSTPSSASFGPYAGKSLFQVTVYANAGGETISFQFHDGSSTTALSETLAFVVNGNEGGVTSPLVLSGPAAPAVDWSVTASDFSDTMTLTAIVAINGADQPSGTLGAFVGTQVRGVQSTPSSASFGPYAGKSLFQVTVYANAGGETISFQFHDGSSSTALSETLAFVVNGNEGSVTSPLVLSGPAAPAVDWSVTASDFSDTMTLTAIVAINGADQPSGTLGAFVGTQVRGVQSTPSSASFGPYAGKSLFQVTVYANAGGETISFQFHDGSSSTALSETLEFVVNGNEGSVTSPLALSGPATSSSASPSSPLRPPPPPSAPPLHPPLTYATTTSMLLSVGASGGLTASQLMSSLTQAATTADTSSVSVSLVVQSSLTATLPASRSAEQVAAALQLSICSTSDNSGCSVTTSRTDRRHLQTAASASFTVEQVISLTSNQSLSEVLVAPSVNVSDVSSLLAVDSSELDVGTPTVAGVAATLSVEATGTPTATVAESLSTTSMAAALGVDASQLSVLEAPRTVTPPAPPPTQPPSPPTLPPPSLPPPPQPMVNVIVDVAVPSPERAIAISTRFSVGMFASTWALSHSLASRGVSGLQVVSIEAPVPQSVLDGVATRLTVTTYRVRSRFTAYGSVEQYESSMRASIAAVVAAEGLVSASDVIVDC